MISSASHRATACHAHTYIMGVHARPHICIYTCIYVRTCVDMHTCICVYVCKHNVYVQACTYSDLHVDFPEQRVIFLYCICPICFINLQLLVLLTSNSLALRLTIQNGTLWIASDAIKEIGMNL